MPTSWIDYGRGISGFRTLKMPITRRVLWRGGSGRVAKQPYRGKRGPQTSSKCSLLMTCKRLKQFMRFSALLTARAEPAKRGMLVVVVPRTCEILSTRQAPPYRHHNLSLTHPTKAISQPSAIRFLEKLIINEPGSWRLSHWNSASISFQICDSREQFKNCS